MLTPFIRLFPHPDPPFNPGFAATCNLLDHDATRVVLTQPLHRRMTRLRNGPYDLQPNS